MSRPAVGIPLLKGIDMLFRGGDHQVFESRLERREKIKKIVWQAGSVAGILSSARPSHFGCSAAPVFEGEGKE